MEEPWAVRAWWGLELDDFEGPFQPSHAVGLLAEFLLTETAASVPLPFLSCHAPFHVGVQAQY